MCHVSRGFVVLLLKWKTLGHERRHKTVVASLRFVLQVTKEAPPLSPPKQHAPWRHSRTLAIAAREQLSTVSASTQHGAERETPVPALTTGAPNNGGAAETPPQPTTNLSRPLSLPVSVFKSVSRRSLCVLSVVLCVPCSVFGVLLLFCSLTPLLSCSPTLSQSLSVCRCVSYTATLSLAFFLSFATAFLLSYSLTLALYPRNIKS